MRTKKSLRKWLRTASLLIIFLSGMFPGGLFTQLRTPPVYADSTPQTLPFSQNWSSTGQITTDDNWAGVPGVVGFRGDDLTTVTATDPQTILADGSGTPVDVIANQTNPNTQATGGVAEFDGIANPVVAIQGSGTADAPHIVISVNTTGMSGIVIGYILRDIDGSTDNAVQPVALQFRVGSTGNFTNIPAGFVADATSGPSLATLVTPVSATLPAAANNQPLVQIRIMTTNAIGNDEWVGIDDILIFVPSAARVDSFSASGYENGNVLLEWKTGLDVDNLGFNVYRDVRGKRTRINPQLLAGSALMVGGGTHLRSGRSYAWADDLPKSRDAQYWLEEVDLNGQSTWHGPVGIDRSTSRDKLPPSSARAVLLNSLAAGAVQSNSPTQVPRVADTGASQFTAQAEIASRPAIKLSVKQEGWYRVTGQELLAAGLDPATDPRLLQLFAEGREQAFAVKGEGDGRFDSSDSIEFYGLGLDTPSTDTRIYWLVAGSQPGQRIKAAKKKGSRDASTGFDYTVQRRDRSVYFSALTNGDTENFFGTPIVRTPVEQSLLLRHVNRASTEDATLDVTLQGVTGFAHRVQIQLNGSELGEISFASLQQGAGKFTVPHSLIKEGQNTVTLTGKGGESDVSLVDSIRLTYSHSYTADDDALRFTASKKQQVTIDGFTNSAIRVVDVTDPSAPLEMQGKIENRGNGYAVTIPGQKTNGRTLMAFSEPQVKRPVAVVADQLSNLKDKSRGADYIIITRRDFFSGVEPLKAHRQNQGLDVSVVDVEDIYDEFNFGEKSVQAVKDFLFFAKTNWSKAPRFVLLVGDASFDPKNYFGSGDSDMVPTRLVDTILMEAASDEWLADFDGDGLGEMRMGRLSARTLDEISLMAGKIIAYDNSPIGNGVLLVSDSDDSGINFENGSTQLRGIIPDGVNVGEIVRGKMDDAATKSAILDQVNRGQRIVNYFGHGSVGLWRGDLLTSTDTKDMTGGDTHTLFFAITCLNGYFQDPALDSLAESLVKSEHGGAAAVWASSGMCEADSQLSMNLELFRSIFGDNSNGEAMTLGDALLKAKSAISDQDVRRTYILFGDPAMRLR